MIDEIKELIDKLKDNDWYDELDLTGTKWVELTWEETHLLLDYITTLQEENKELKLLSMTQNNREYRSKFLKEYQKEHGENCYPDYDEIYKRYDKLKSNNDAAIEIYKNRMFIEYKQKRFMEDKTTADLMYEALQGDDK